MGPTREGHGGRGPPHQPLHNDQGTERVTEDWLHRRLPVRRGIWAPSARLQRSQGCQCLWRSTRVPCQLPWGAYLTQLFATGPPAGLANGRPWWGWRQEEGRGGYFFLPLRPHPLASDNSGESRCLEAKVAKHPSCRRVGHPSHPPWQGCQRPRGHEDNEEHPPVFRSYRPLTPAKRNL